MSYFTLRAISAPLATLEGLKHAVLQSVLNHGSATANDQARMGNKQRGGCWHDAYVPAVGSRDWTLEREKLTDQTLIRAKRFYEDALQWLVDNGHAASFEVEVKRLSPTAIGRTVKITTNTGIILEVPL